MKANTVETKSLNAAESKSRPPNGAAMVRELTRCGVNYVVTVPDWVQIPLHRALEAEPDGGIRLLNCCTEDEAFTMAAGLHIGGKKSAIVIQNQGLYAGLNALRGAGLDASIPMVMLIGQFGREVANFDASPRTSNRRVVNILEPLLAMLDIPYWNIERADQIGNIAKAFDAAEQRQSPAAVILDRNMAWD